MLTSNSALIKLKETTNQIYLATNYLKQKSCENRATDDLRSPLKCSPYFLQSFTLREKTYILGYLSKTSSSYLAWCQHRHFIEC